MCNPQPGVGLWPREGYARELTGNDDPDDQQSGMRQSQSLESANAADVSDIELEGAMVAAAKRDPREFGALYERYVDRIYRYAYRRVGTHHEAEDITAQTFQQALQALPDYEWRGLPFGAWLFRIAGNIINRRGRTIGREVPVEDVTVFSSYEESDDDPADRVWRSEQADELAGMISKLPPDQQRVLVLKFSHGLKNREIGDLMGRSEGAVKQLVHRALVALRGTIERDYV